MTAWPLTRHVKRPACLLAPLLLLLWTSAAVAADATVTAQTCQTLPKVHAARRWLQLTMSPLYPRSRRI